MLSPPSPSTHAGIVLAERRRKTRELVRTGFYLARYGCLKAGGVPTTQLSSTLQYHTFRHVGYRHRVLIHLYSKDSLHSKFSKSRMLQFSSLSLIRASKLSDNWNCGSEGPPLPLSPSPPRRKKVGLISVLRTQYRK
jgi:hypothetical protein